MMSPEAGPDTEPHESSSLFHAPLTYLYRRWRALDRGWQAVSLSAVLVLAVGLGLPIPW